MNIAIIGGGITGLTTALVLTKKGMKCQVFERANQLSEVGAGIWMQPNAMKILNHLEIGNLIKDAGMPLTQVEIANSNLVPLRKTDGITTEENSNEIVSIHRARLQKILFESLPPNTVHFGKEYVSHASKNDEITVQFSDESITTNVLLGADGINSLLRKKMFPSEIRYSGQTCWRGISQLSLSKEMLANGKELWGDNIRFGFANISPAEVYWFAVAKAPQNEKDNPLERKSLLLTNYKSFHPLVTEIIEKTPDDKIIRNDISDLKRLNTWHKDNICLLGDAAHATTPNMGQGAGQGIEDAYYIGQYLSQNKPVDAFTKFENSRRKKVDYVVKNSWMFGKMAHSSFGRFTMKIVMKITPEKVLLKQMKTLYEVEGL